MIESKADKRIVFVLVCMICLCLLSGFIHGTIQLLFFLPSSFGIWLAGEAISKNIGYTNIVETPEYIVSSGPYKIIRHPQYSGILIFVLSFGFMTGSSLSLFFSILSCAVMVLRIIEEEKFLKLHSVEYSKYCNKVRFRLIPFIY